MDLDGILEEMYREHEAISESIAALERLAAASVKLRGRPPKWLLDAQKTADRQMGEGSSTGRGKPG